MIQFEDVTHLFKIDWLRFQDHVRKLEAKLPKAGGDLFNGWSVQSASGKYTDGWIDGSRFFKTNEAGEVTGYDTAAAKAAGYFASRFHTKITNAAGLDAIQAIMTASKLGLSPVRARLIQLTPGSKSAWHTDGTADKLILRLHLVVETNPGCWFIHSNGRQHLEGQHAYLLNVNDFHQVVNEGTTNRTHLVVDVTDTKRISKVHHARS